MSCRPYPWEPGELIRLKLNAGGRMVTALLIGRPRCPKWGNYPWVLPVLLDGRVLELREDQFVQARPCPLRRRSTRRHRV
jgi:hypothetical protein